MRCCGRFNGRLPTRYRGLKAHSHCSSNSKLGCLYIGEIIGGRACSFTCRVYSSVEA